MKFHPRLRILFVLLMLISASSLFAAETIAVVIKAQGKVKLIRQSGTEIDLTRGLRLEDGDKLETGKKSFAALRFIDDASLVRLGENTVCTIQGKKTNNEISKNIHVEAGALLSRVSRLKGKYQVSTPTSVASVKGTEFAAEHRSNPGTYYFGFEGEVDVTSGAGSQTLEPGFTVYVAHPDSLPEKFPTQPGSAPEFGQGTAPIDEFEIEFEDGSGQKKILRIKVQEMLN